MTIQVEQLSFESLNNINNDFIESCFKQLEKYNYKASYYWRLLTYPSKTPDLSKKQRARLLQNKFRKDAISQLEQLFKVKNIYDINNNLAPLVEKFFRQIYIPNPILIEQILQLQTILNHQKFAYNYDLTNQIDNYHTFESELRQQLTYNAKKDISPSPRIELFLDYE